MTFLPTREALEMASGAGEDARIREEFLALAREAQSTWFPYKEG